MASFFWKPIASFFSSRPDPRKNDAIGFKKNDAREVSTIQLVQLKLSLREAPWRHFSGNL